MRLVTVLLLGACATTPLRQARQAGLSRQGPHRATSLVLMGLDVQVHTDAPLTGSAASPIVLPAVAELDAASLTSAVRSQFSEAGEHVGIMVRAEEVMAWGESLPEDLPARLQPLVGRDAEGAVLLRVHVGLCPVDGQAVPCVRSPDTALGYGPPAIDGLVFSRFKPSSDGAFAKRVTVVSKDYTYRIDRDSGAHWDKPFIGAGDSPQAQAEDAIAQAVAAWMRVYAGRRGQRHASAD